MKQRTRYLLLGVAVLAAALLGRQLWPKAQTPLRASLVAQAAPAGADGFARAEGPRPFVFPADRGPHNDYQTEWWYYTGNLTAASGEHFGYQLTFFRRALTPPGQRAERASAWGTDQVYMAHFAVTDVAGNQHYSFERLARGAGGVAGAQAEPYRVWLDDWVVAEAAEKSVPGDPGVAGPARLRAAAGELALDLVLADLKPPVLQGDQGYSRKGPEPGNASYYVSRTRIATEGTVTAAGKTYSVSGLSWMDQEWSTSALGAAQVGWDWFSIQLDNGAELMVFQLRRADGSVDAFSSGTLIAAEGTTRQLGPNDFSIQPAGQWRSPRTGGVYPAEWTVSVPEADLRLTIAPWLADQEMQVSYSYWEGAVRVTGTSGGQAIQGNGYVELTGYAESLQNKF